jgi:two-component system sensor histidine kinase UhpB
MSPTDASGTLQYNDLMAQPQAIHAALEGMVTIDEQMRIIMINPAALRMFGRMAAHTVGLPLDELIPERFRTSHQLHIQRFLASDEIERPMGQARQLLGLRANGEEFPLKAAICKVELMTENGLQRCCTAMLYDCSKERMLTDAIEKLSQQMRTVFERAPIAIWITDGEQIAFANRACGKLFGVHSPDALVGQSIQGRLHVDAHDSGFKWPQEGAVDDEESVMLTGTVTRPDGSRREVEIAVTPMPDHGREFVQMVIVDTTQRSLERRKLLNSKHSLRDLTAHIVDAREEERKRIARELHDELGQRLTALKLALAANAQRKAPKADQAQFMIDMVDETMKAVRRLALGLRPPMLDDLGLCAAIEWLVSDFKDRHPVQVELRLDDPQKALSPATSISLYRILQEALTNISRHAGAQRIQIGLDRKERWIELLVQDDGRGLPEPDGGLKRGSFGLIGMRERVRMLGGQLQFRNGASGGAQLLVRLPMADRENPSSLSPIIESAPPPDSDFSLLTPWEGH